MTKSFFEYGFHIQRMEIALKGFRTPDLKLTKLALYH
jgi:hypothetical protein